MFEFHIKSLWSGDAIWQCRSESTLTQVMGCFLMAPGYYLNHCWLIIVDVFWHSPEGHFTGNAADIYLHVSLKITYYILQLDLPGANKLQIIIHTSPNLDSLVQYYVPCFYSSILSQLQIFIQITYKMYSFPDQRGSNMDIFCGFKMLNSCICLIINSLRKYYVNMKLIWYW